MRYDAFISYSHGADARLAPALQRALHRFAKPWWKLRAVNVFRDETSLTLATSLPDTLTAALSASENFVLMASPLAAQSKWVAGECDWWLKNKDPGRVFIVLSEGKIVWEDAAADFDWARTTALPPALRGAFRHHPLYLDLRWAKASEALSERDPRFLDAVARLSAALRGVSLDAIAGEDVRQHRRTRRVAYAALSAMALLATGASAGAWIATERSREAERQRDNADLQRLGAERNLYLASSSLATLANALVRGTDRHADDPIGARSFLLEQILDALERLDPLRRSPMIQQSQAQTLRLLSRDNVALGRLDNALRHAEASLAIAEKLAAELPDRDDAPDRSLRRAIVVDLAEGHEQVGSVLRAMSGFDRALAAYGKAMAIREQLARRGAGNDTWRNGPAHSQLLIGHLLLQQGRLPDALAAYRAVHPAIEADAARNPFSAELQAEIAENQDRIGDILFAQSDFAGALRAYGVALNARKKRETQRLTVKEWPPLLAISYDKIGGALQAQGNSAQALEAYTAGVAQREKIVALGAGKSEWAHDLFDAHLKVGLFAWRLGNFAAAKSAFEKAKAIIGQLLLTDTNNARWERDKNWVEAMLTEVLRGRRLAPFVIRAE